MSLIGKPTLTNNETCEIPFAFNGINNYFCVENNGSFQCNTVENGEDFSECDLGKILQLLSVI
jgi:hypothetical protein